MILIISIQWEMTFLFNVYGTDPCNKKCIKTCIIVMTSKNNICLVLSMSQCHSFNNLCNPVCKVKPLRDFKQMCKAAIIFVPNQSHLFSQFAGVQRLTASFHIICKKLLHFDLARFLVSHDLVMFRNDY